MHALAPKAQATQVVVAAVVPIAAVLIVVKPKDPQAELHAEELEETQATHVEPTV